MVAVPAWWPRFGDATGVALRDSASEHGAVPNLVAEAEQEIHDHWNK
jgi:hypothetical protein